MSCPLQCLSVREGNEGERSKAREACDVDEGEVDGDILKWMGSLRESHLDRHLELRGLAFSHDDPSSPLDRSRLMCFGLSSRETRTLRVSMF